MHPDPGHAGSLIVRPRIISHDAPYAGAETRVAEIVRVRSIVAAGRVARRSVTSAAPAVVSAAAVPTVPSVSALLGGSLHGGRGDGRHDGGRDGA